MFGSLSALSICVKSVVLQVIVITLSSESKVIQSEVAFDNNELSVSDDCESDIEEARIDDIVLNVMNNAKTKKVSNIIITRVISGLRCNIIKLVQYIYSYGIPYLDYYAYW